MVEEIIGDKSENRIKKIVPGLSDQFKQGLWLPEMAQMRNPRLVKAAKGSLDALGVKYRENIQVEHLKIVDGVIKGVVANGENFKARQVLIAGGAWTAEILKESGHVPDIKPVKGQMILFKGEPGMLKSMLLAENRYLIPRNDGRILCGSTIEHTGFDKSTSQQVKEKLQQSASEIYPALEKLDVEFHWAGLRPGSPDGVPYIGEHASVKGLYINSGHYRNGVILGIGSCRKVAEYIVNA